jgi:hypothetical protein
MTLQPGCRFVVAPRFHLPADWTRRLLIGAGVAEAAGGFYPRQSWRPPTAGELALLVRAAEEPTPADELESSVCVFQLPEHLQSEWWQTLEQAAGVLGEGQLPGFEGFVSQVGAFLGFKGIPVPEGARCEVVLSDPAQRSASRAGLRWPGLWGGINLGDEETSVVLINLPCEQLEVELRSRFPDQPAPAAGELAERFLRSCADYPLVRLILGPREGYRLPRAGLILSGYLEGKQEPDVMLSIAAERSP